MLITGNRLAMAIAGNQDVFWHFSLFVLVFYMGSTQHHRKIYDYYYSCNLFTPTIHVFYRTIPIRYVDRVSELECVRVFMIE